MLRGVQRCCRAAARQSLAPAAHESVIEAGAAVSSMWIQSSRYASNDAGSDETEAPISPAIEELADRILELNILQVAQLSKTLKRRMGLPESPFVMGMPMGMQMPGAPAATGGDGGQADEPAEEKTDFNVKLDSFPSDIKIKLIKEVRALLPDLGLKEAKALVEKTPAVLKEKVPKEEAAAMQKKLEELGAKVLLE